MSRVVIRLIAVAAVTAICGQAARASDKLAFEPVPAWVQPVEPAASSDAATEAPVRFLLSDQQVLLEPGRRTTFTNFIVRIQNAQGLAAGNLSFPWQPATDDVTVHKVHIRRAGQIIDVLGAGQTFTVARRESNLELATLDGVLTANIQPEGLQVGDSLDFAVSVTTRDPTLKGHVEQFGAAWNHMVIDRAHFRAQWPSSLGIRLRQSGALPPLKAVRVGSTTQVEMTLNNLQPTTFPKGAPHRFALGKVVELTDFTSWAETGALFAPLYDAASVIPQQGVLRDELERIRSASADPAARAAAALGLVQDRIRYVALQMGTGGYVPVAADTTWARRYGDCKAKTALLLGLLHELGIAAEPVAVSSSQGDGIDARLPMIGLFDHVLVRATIAGRTYWLDGTRTGDTDLDRLEIPDYRWGLPLLKKDAGLVRIVPGPMTSPSNDLVILMDASGGIGLPAPTTLERTISGDEAVGINAALSGLGPEARDRALREVWRQEFDFVDAEKVDARFDRTTGKLVLSLTGKARMDWSSGFYYTDGTGVGYNADFKRDKDQDQTAPYAVPYPYFTRTQQTIKLPPGFFRSGQVPVAAQVDKTVAGIEYRRSARREGDTFVVEMTQRSVVPEFAAAEAPAAQTALRELADQAIAIRKPAGYRPTEAEVALTATQTPTTAKGFLDRGNLFLNRFELEPALRDFESALALEPNSEMALAARGIVRVWMKQRDLASKDLDLVYSRNPQNIVVLRARGLLEELDRNWGKAIAAYDEALAVAPSDAFSLGHRAIAHHALRQYDLALRDSAASLAIDPSWTNLHALRLEIFRAQNKPAEALLEAAAVAERNPTDPYAHVAAAALYARLGNQTEAMAEYERALAIEQTAHIYLSRAANRPRTDRAGRRSDIEAALRIEPTRHDALIAKARLLEETGDLAGAREIAATLVQRSPDNLAYLNLRGILGVKAGDLQAASRDFAAARAKATTSELLNNLCWDKATAGVALETALAECDAALLKDPGAPALLDSRALVLLKLNRIDEAIDNYSRALAKLPTLAPSLYGRAIAYERKGDAAKSRSDAEAALKMDSNLTEQFELYGLKLAS